MANPFGDGGYTIELYLKKNMTILFGIIHAPVMFLFYIDDV